MKLRRFPLQCTFELTRRCNLRCPHCYVGSERGISPEEELSTGQIFSLLDQIAAEGCLFVTFTGGEPLLRSDFRDIFSYALRKGFLVGIFSNATLIDEELATFFKKYPPFYIDVTLNGVTPGTYEKMTGVRGSFERCLSAIGLLKKYDVPFRLKAVITRINRHEIGEIRNFVRGMGKLLRFDTLLCARLDGSRDALASRLTPEEIISLDREDEGKWSDLLDFACRQMGKTVSDRLYKCGGGLHSFHISSSGKLGLCVLDTNYSYDLLEGNFHEGWHRFIPAVRRIPLIKKIECEGCRYRPICRSCPAWSKLETGSPDNPVEFLCRIAHLMGRELQKDMRLKNEQKEKVSQT